jgi:glycerophosphoryl diester phosphodiesterase
MSIASLLSRLFQESADLIYSRMPQPEPGSETLKTCRLVSHRGEHDNIRVFENTCAAFDSALKAGVWGIEFDVRWTRDLHPVVFHDPDCQRLFKSRTPILGLTLKELRETFSLIPTLEEVIQRYGKKMHLMAEIKEEEWPDRAYQNQVLRTLFSSLAPCEDFHLLALDPALFDRIDFVSSHAFLPVAEANIRQLSAWALKHDCAGLAGHYVLLTRTMLERHRERGHKVATGFIASKNSLYRELNRGVDWIFTNSAVSLQTSCKSLPAATQRIQP